MLSHVIPHCLVTDRIPIKLQLTGKSRLIFEFLAEMERHTNEPPALFMYMSQIMISLIGSEK